MAVSRAVNRCVEWSKSQTAVNFVAFEDESERVVQMKKCLQLSSDRYRELLQ